MFCYRLTALILSLLFTQQAFAQLPPDRKLKDALELLLEKHAGQVGLAIKNLESGVHYEYQAGQRMPTASLIKFPLMVVVYRLIEAKKLDAKKLIELRSGDKVPGSGILTEHFSDGIKIPLVDCVRLMIRYSDNTATNLVIDQIGLERVKQVFAELNLSNTHMNSKVYRGDTTIAPELSRQFGIGCTTAAEMVQLLTQLEADELASATATKEMFAHLAACEDQTKLAAGLPAGTYFAHKTGAIANCRTDAGIIETQGGKVAVCFLSNRNEDQSWQDGNEAHQLAAKVGKIIVERFGGQESDDRLQEGAFGKKVEALQRTLNARLDPSPALSIDGDFGPATRAAVERFQRSNGLEADGIVHRETWKKLGSILFEEAAVPSPEVVNAEKLAKETLPPLDGPPFITAKAWIVLDAESGKPIASHNEKQQLAPASTTKVMTAYVILKYAQENPAALLETIEYSVEADKTRGSTSAVRSGERLSVNDALYGLLLPSGNDASVALAEHFGKRIAASLGIAASEGLSGEYGALVASMNETAKQLGLENTHLTNTHGMTEVEHYMSAADLAVLAREAMRFELFRKIVSTRQYGAELTSKDGYRRNILWRNTNRLLKYEGFSGIKTGTTSAAGACLVGYGVRGKTSLIAVVLGASSSDARYADIQNLFRWAWRHKEAPQSNN